MAFPPATLGLNPVSAPIPMPPPAKGWNTRDQYDAMDPLDAVQLDNWYPDAGGVLVRNGYQEFCDLGGSDAVETLAEFDSSSTRHFLAAAGAKVWNITNPGTPAELGSGFTSARWQTVNFLSRTFLVNGEDDMQVYNGTTLDTAAFTGVSLDTLDGCWQYQQRLFFWDSTTPGFWYAPLNSISGMLQFFDLSAFAPNGGNLINMTNFTHDGSNGVNDFAVFLMSSGDTLVYYGNDPGLLSGWQLTGRFRLAPPVSPRAMTVYGGDAFATTFDDHVPLHNQLVALQSGTLPPRSKVSGAVAKAVAAGAGLFGWQALFYPKGRRLIYNIPNPNGSFDQHVCNTALPNAPWCRFTGMNAHCWGLFDNDLYFGGAAGKIYQADTGGLDNLGAIQTVAQQAWNKLDSPQRKRVAAVRPVLQTRGSLAYEFAVGFDYQPLSIPVPVVTTATGSFWNTSYWNVAPWSTEDSVNVQWRIAGGSGTSVGWGIALASTAGATWFRTDLRLEGGNAF